MIKKEQYLDISGIQVLINELKQIPMEESYNWPAAIAELVTYLKVLSTQNPHATLTATQFKDAIIFYSGRNCDIGQGIHASPDIGTDLVSIVIKVF